MIYINITDNSLFCSIFIFLFYIFEVARWGDGTGLTSSAGGVLLVWIKVGSGEVVLTFVFSHLSALISFSLSLGDDPI